MKLKNKYGRLTSEGIFRIKEMVKSGISKKEIARKLKVNEVTIHYHTSGLKENKLKYNAKRLKKLYHTDKKFRKKIDKTQKQYYQSNKEKIKAWHRKWYAEHEELLREYRRRYYRKHRKQCLRYSKKYAKENRKALREYARKYYHKNPEKRKITTERWRKKNLKKVAEMRRKWYHKNKERVLKYQKERYKKKAA